jgi:hypothetical protein
LPGAAQVDPWIFVQPEFAGIQAMLAGENERGRDAVRKQGSSDGLQFDGFRPGTDDQPYIPGTQTSP